MKRRLLMLLALLCAATAQAANEDTAKSAYDAAKKEADHRYSEDQKLCADEATSARRMQCLRDAKEEHARALTAAESKLGAASKPSQGAAPCTDCGKVTSVRISEKDGEGSAVGMIAGGVAGALLGRQVGKGSGKDVATLAGAAGGAYAGNKIEGKMKKIKTWSVAVRFDHGEERVFNFDHDPGLAVGDPVKTAGSSVARC